MSTPPELASLAKAAFDAQQRLAEAIRSLPPQAVKDYEFMAAGSGATVRLSQLFGTKPDLIIVHNMGRACSYCTLWADGFAGLYKHLADRASFVLSTPDEPAPAAAFAASRHWPFPVVSIAGTTFPVDMGWQGPRGGVLPGLSTFRLDASGGIVRTAKSPQLGPGDPFCSLWHLLDLLPERANGWEPKFHY